MAICSALSISSLLLIVRAIGCPVLSTTEPLVLPRNDPLDETEFLLTAEETLVFEFTRKRLKLLGLAAFTDSDGDLVDPSLLLLLSIVAVAALDLALCPKKKELMEVPLLI